MHVDGPSGSKSRNGHTKGSVDESLGRVRVNYSYLLHFDNTTGYPNLTSSTLISPHSTPYLTLLVITRE